MGVGGQGWQPEGISQKESQYAPWESAESTPGEMSGENSMMILVMLRKLEGADLREHLYLQDFLNIQIFNLFEAELLEKYYFLCNYYL